MQKCGPLTGRTGLRGLARNLVISLEIDERQFPLAFSIRQLFPQGGMLQSPVRVGVPTWIPMSRGVKGMPAFTQSPSFRCGISPRYAVLDTFQIKDT